MDRALTMGSVVVDTSNRPHLDPPELSQLRSERDELAEQLRKLMKAEATLYAYQQQLEDRRDVERGLVEFGRASSKAKTVKDILQEIVSYSLYSLKFERCIVLLSDPDGTFRSRCHYGFFNEDEQRAQSANVATDHPIVRAIEKEDPWTCAAESVGPIYDLGRDLFGMDEYFVHGFSYRSEKHGRGLVVVGNRKTKARHHSRAVPGSENLPVLGTMVNLASIAIENVQNYEALRLRAEEVERANRMKTAFLATISHELRTPLNSIIGFTRIVMRKTKGLIPRLQHSNLSKVEQSALHLLDIINDILDMSRVEAGHVEIQLRPVEVYTLAIDVVESLRPQADARSLVLVAEAPQDLSMVTDAQRLQQILTNLVSNAIRFTDEGSVCVRVEPIPGTSRVSFCVSDTGLGIPKARLREIFEPFVQIDSSRTRERGGTGLGLAIVRHLVMLLGGKIQVESELGQGSRFFFDLPVEPESTTETDRGETP